MSENPAPQPSEGTETPKKKKRRGGTPLALTVFLMLAFALQSTVILLLLGMMPTIIAFYVDRSKSKAIFGSVFACNFSGVLPYVAGLVASGNSLSLFFQTMMDPMTWFQIYLAAAAGWLLVEGAPRAVGFVLEMTAQAKIVRLRMRQKQLYDEWGPDIAVEEQ